MSIVNHIQKITKQIFNKICFTVVLATECQIGLEKLVNKTETSSLWSLLPHSNVVEKQTTLGPKTLTTSRNWRCLHPEGDLWCCGPLNSGTFREQQHKQKAKEEMGFAVFGIICSRGQTSQIQDEHNKCTSRSRKHSSEFILVTVLERHRPLAPVDVTAGGSGPQTSDLNRFQQCSAGEL